MSKTRKVDIRNSKGEKEDYRTLDKEEWISKCKIFQQVQQGRNAVVTVVKDGWYVSALMIQDTEPSDIGHRIINR